MIGGKMMSVGLTMLGNDAEAVKESPGRQPCRRVQCLLWNEIAGLLNPGERDVVRKAIGVSVIEENEVLFREAAAYEEILQFVDDDMQRQIASHRILDTPARQMLEKEIKLLVQHIQQSSSCEPSSAEDGSFFEAACDSEEKKRNVVKERTDGVEQSGKALASPRKNSAARDPLALIGKCKNTLDYVLSKTAIQEKQKCGNPSRFPPCSSSLYRGTSSSSSNEGARRRVAVDPSFIVRKMAAHLNVTGIDAVVDRLRHAFAAEHDALLEHVECLRAYLEDSADVYSSVKNNPPTLTEMKDCGKKLEETWTALKHCQNIQSILAPVERLQSGCTVQVPEPVLLPQSKLQAEMLPGNSRKAIRLPKMR